MLLSHPDVFSSWKQRRHPSICDWAADCQNSAKGCSQVNVPWCVLEYSEPHRWLQWVPTSRNSPTSGSVTYADRSQVWCNGHHKPLSTAPQFGYSQKKQHLGFKAWFVCTAPQPWTHCKSQGSVCYSRYSKRKSNQGPCAKSQLSLLVSHRSKTPPNKIAFTMWWIRNSAGPGVRGKR